MDTWKFFDITHRQHVFCNATSEQKMDELCELIAPEAGSRVLDIACGKAELLLRLVERFGVRGVGVDISRFVIAEAQAKRRARTPDADLEFVELDGAEYRPEEGEEFDVAMCLGASWTFGGHRGTLRALMAWARPGGMLVVGEPYWIQEPCADYLDAEGCARADFGSHHDNVRIGEEQGLSFLYSQVSSQDDWDRYEGLQYLAAENYAREHPEDPDLAEIMRRVHASREAYLKWGRDTLGWAIYLFRMPA